VDEEKKMTRAKRSNARMSKGGAKSGTRRNLLLVNDLDHFARKRRGTYKGVGMHAITGDSPKMHAIAYKPLDPKPKPTQIPVTKRQKSKPKKRKRIPVVDVGPKSKPVNNGKSCKNAAPCIY